jgi:hypothetical protein
MKTQIYFYHSNLSNIRDVFEIKSYFKNKNVAFNNMLYKGESRDLLVDSLNVTHYQYLISNSIPLLTKPMNWVLCTYFDTETNQHELVLGKENILQLFE